MSSHLFSMGRFDLTDRQWARLQPFLPPEKPHTGRPNHDHRRILNRRILNGILWVHRTGAPWRDLPEERYGPVGTVSSRFSRWRQAGVWDRLLAALQETAEARGEIDWTLHLVDATGVRAHQHAAGARREGEKRGSRPRRTRRPRRWAGRRAASRARSTSALRAKAGRVPSP